MWSSMQNVKWAWLWLWSQAPTTVWVKTEQEWPAAFHGGSLQPCCWVSYCLLQVLDTVLGQLGNPSSHERGILNELHYSTKFCGWQIRPHATSCSMGCLANCLSFQPVVWFTILTGINPRSVTDSNDWKAEMIRHHLVQYSLWLTSNISLLMPKSRVIMHW